MKTLFAVLAFVTIAALAADTNILTGRQRMEQRRAEMLSRRTNVVVTPSLPKTNVLSGRERMLQRRAELASKTNAYKWQFKWATNRLGERVLVPNK